MKWAHLLCAMWIPEVSLGNATFQEPVQDVEKVPKTRWKLVSGNKSLVHGKRLIIVVVVLYLQAEDGCLHPMWAQIMLRGVSRHLRPESETMLAHEIISGIESSRLNSTESILR
jgi:hypothetical protein